MLSGIHYSIIVVGTHFDYGSGGATGIVPHHGRKGTRINAQHPEVAKKLQQRLANIIEAGRSRPE